MIRCCALVAATLLIAASPAPVRPPDGTYSYAIVANGRPVGTSTVTFATANGDVGVKESASISAPIALTAKTRWTFDATTLREKTYGADFVLASRTDHVDATVADGTVHLTTGDGHSLDIPADAAAPLVYSDDHLLTLQALVPAIVQASGAKAVSFAQVAGARTLVARVDNGTPSAVPAAAKPSDASLTIAVADLHVTYWYDPASYVVHDIVIPEQHVEMRLTAQAAAGVAVATPAPIVMPTALPTPFPHFTSREVTFRSSDGTLLAGTLTVPRRGKAPFPAVVFVHGSGKHDRDETIGPNKIFLQLSNALSNAGIAVLRYDKRGAGKSGGGATPGTRPELLADVEAAFAFVRRQPQIDTRRVYILGHSEGGELVPTVAAHDRRVAGIVLLAPPAVKLRQIIMEQAVAYVPPAQRAAHERLERVALDAMLRRKIPATAWIRSSVDVDPAVDIARVAAPILIFQGTVDQQISPQELPRLVNAARAAKRDVTVRVLAGDDHLFEPAPKSFTSEQNMLLHYMTVPERVDPRVAADIVAWFRGTRAVAH